MSKYARQVDGNHDKIRDRLRQIPGITVDDMSKIGGGFPDLMIGGISQHPHNCGEPMFFLVEVKTPEGKLRLSQIKFIERWEDHVSIIVARGVVDVLLHLGFSQAQAVYLDDD